MAQVANTLNGPFSLGGALWDILHGIMANIPILKDISSFKQFLARVVNGLCLGTLPGGGVVTATTTPTSTQVTHLAGLI